MTKGDLVYQRNTHVKDSLGPGIIIQLQAGAGSFSTWVDVMWKDGSIHTYEPHELTKAEDDLHPYS